MQHAYSMHAACHAGEGSRAAGSPRVDSSGGSPVHSHIYRYVYDIAMCQCVAYHTVTAQLVTVHPLCTGCMYTVNPHARGGLLRVPPRREYNLLCRPMVCEIHEREVRRVVQRRREVAQRGRV